MGLLSSLNALRAFEAAARHQSFSAAAEELHVSSAAVGQLVRSLEDAIGAPLFSRASSGRQRLLPNALALSALPDLRAGFERLQLGASKLAQPVANGSIKLTVSPAFAAKWLLPRIERFTAQVPDTDLLMDTSQRLVDFVAQQIDVGVRYGAGRWPGLVADKLMDELVFPVCSPAYANTHKFHKPQDLLLHPLIHDMTGAGSQDYVNWAAWFAHAGVGQASVHRGHRINNSAAVLQAAVDGQGIALARGVMACDDVSSGRLVRLFPDIAVLSPLAYYAVYREETAAKPGLQAFLDWLKHEASIDCVALKTQAIPKTNVKAKAKAKVSKRASA